MFLKKAVEHFQNSLKNEIYVFVFAESVPRRANT